MDLQIEKKYNSNVVKCANEVPKGNQPIPRLVDSHSARL